MFRSNNNLVKQNYDSKKVSCINVDSHSLKRWSIAKGKREELRGREAGGGGFTVNLKVSLPPPSPGPRPPLSKKLFPLGRVGKKTASREVGIFFFSLISIFFKLECTGGGE